MDSDDDFFAPAGAQGSAADPLVDQEYARLEQRYTDAGYREGITDGKLSMLQAGFDAAFAASAPLARAVGNLRGRAAALLLVAEAGAGGGRTAGTAGTTGTTAAAAGAEPDSPAALAALRALLADLARVKRDAVLPVDHERIAHEREAHDAGAAGGGAGAGEFELGRTDGREMEALLDGLEALGGAGGAGGMGGASGAGAGAGGHGAARGQALIDELAARLAAIERALV